MLRCTEVTERCAEVHRGVCRGAWKGMWMCRGTWTGVQWYMDVCRGAQSYVQRCGGIGMQRCTEGYRGAQMYVEVHGGVTGLHGGVYGGARRWTEGCVEVDRECTEVCRGLYRGMLGM